MTDAPLVGRTLSDRYRIDTLLARGGMSLVYRAHDRRLERDVAIKVLAEPYAADDGFTARFLDEGRLAASLSHPSLVHVYDSGTDGEAHFIVMELLDQYRTVREELDRRGVIPPDEVLSIGQDLLRGLRVVHEHGLVHCDVKVANIMIGPGPAKLIDFGIATPPHLGEEGDTSLGSLRSMSPEQLHGEALTPASDLFSLGAALYEALTGRLPYAGATPDELSAAHAAGAVRPPSTLVEGVPGRLDAAILQALRRDPGARFLSAEAMSAALGSAAEAIAESRADETMVIATPHARSGQPGAEEGYVPPAVPTQAPTSPPRPAAAPPPARRGGGAWGVIGMLLLLGAAALVVVLVIVPLLDLGRSEAGSDPSPTPRSSSPPAPAPVVTVPDFVGMATADAIAAADAADLDWVVHCAQDSDQPKGIIDQEPPAGTELVRGSRMNLYSARIKDCR